MVSVKYPKVQVGQIWKRKNNVSRFRITKLGILPGSNYSWASYINYNGSESDSSLFGRLAADNTPDWGDLDNWELESGAPSMPNTITSNSSINLNDKLLKFFKTPSHPNVCQKCAAPLPCTYH
jgi:hypothetical protein